MIRLHGVSKAYIKSGLETSVLSDVNLSVADGELCALTGPSGSGKTTVMNMIGLLDRPSSGEIKIDGAAVSDLSHETLASMRNSIIGFVFQSFHLLPHLSAMDNVGLPLVYRGMPLGARRAASALALEQVGLSERMTHFPDELSGGQRQRVAIARALVTGPRLLLADEPTGNLDSRSANEIMALLIELNATNDVTTIIVTHDSSIAARCPRRIVMRDGQIFDDNRGQLRGYGS